MFNDAIIKEKQAKIFDYIRNNFDLKTVKLYWSSLLSIRVVFPDEEEIMIFYGEYRDEIVERNIGKSPILKCRDCGITFGVRGQFCNCPGDKLFVDIDNMYYYIRVGGDVEKLIIIRDIQSNVDKSKVEVPPRRKKLKDFI